MIQISDITMARNTTSGRRNFIKSSSLLLASGSLLSTLNAFSFSGSNRKLQKTDKKLGVALVGLGRYSTWQLAPALRQTENCRLAGIVTGSTDKADLWQKGFGLPPDSIYNYDNFDEIAHNDAIDIVYIVLPNSMHAEFTIRAAKAGKHVICEKPMAMNAEEARKMIQACNENQVKLAIGYRLHYDPFHQYLMKLGQQQVFGPIKTIHSNNSAIIRNPREWRLDPALSGGGPLMDLGIYTIQSACYTMGQCPIQITQATYGPNTDPEIYGSMAPSISWQMQFGNGAISSHESAYNASANGLIVQAENGSWSMDPCYGYSGQAGKTPNGPMHFSPVNQQAVQMDDFAYCISHDESTLVPGEMGLRDMVIMDAIKKSAETGDPVVINFDSKPIPTFLEHALRSVQEG